MEISKDHQLKGLFTVVFCVLLISSSMAFAEIEECQVPLEITLRGDVKMKFCEIPAAYGIAIGSENGTRYEKPVKERDFEKSFHLGQYEVTQAQFMSIMFSKPWKKRSKHSVFYNEDTEYEKDSIKEGDNYPAVYVTHKEARRFAHRLSLLDRKATYRLPTEAEWEYAARAGSTTKYYWGDDFNASSAYCWKNSGSVVKHAREVTSCPVPGYCANDFGLMHMAGNVWEFTADASTDNYQDTPTDGHKIITGPAGSGRMVRGGSWNYDAGRARSASRLGVGEDVRYTGMGFRILRMPK